MRASGLNACAPKPCSGWACVTVSTTPRPGASLAGELDDALPAFRPKTAIDHEHQVPADDNADVRHERDPLVGQDEHARSHLGRKTRIHDGQGPVRHDSPHLLRRFDRLIGFRNGCCRQGGEATAQR